MNGLQAMKLCTASVVDGFDGLVLCAGQTETIFTPAPNREMLSRSCVSCTDAMLCVLECCIP